MLFVKLECYLQNLELINGKAQMPFIDLECEFIKL